jgi:protein-tyrosine-phosphatase
MENQIPVKPVVKILFLCTDNSCRSQMAEGWARHLKKGEVEAVSAGIERHGMNPYAVRIMEEGTRGDSGAMLRACRELEAQAREELARTDRDAALDAGPACGEG